MNYNENPIIDLGISTASLYPMITEKSFKILVDKNINLFEVFLNSASEIEEDFIEKINIIRKNNNCVIQSIHPFTSGMEPYMLFSDYYRRFEDMSKYYEKLFKVASKLEAKIIVLHGDTIKCGIKIDEREYFERFFKLAKLAKKYDLILAQENVNLFRSQNIEFIKRMKEYLGEEVSFVLDIKQAIRSKQDPFDLCVTMGQNLVHIHLSDYSEKKDCILPCSGNMDYRRLLNILKSNHYKGTIIIEVYRDAFEKIDELINSYNLFRNIYL